jgi:dihydropteroate synthase
MGVLNITPDSFSDGGSLYVDRRVDLARVCATAEQMIANGAAVLDIGGESTRPGAQPVSLTEELDRVVPVLEVLAGLDVVLSVDTRHAQVAAASIAAGAHIINDVSAGGDPQMWPTIAASGVGYVMMHMQGTPATMQDAPAYTSVVDEVSGYLQQRFSGALQAGIDAQQLMLDPGFGFGKTLQHNLQLLHGLSEVKIADVPLLVGLSRKSMLGALTGKAVEERMVASVAAALIAVQRGADMVRVHDVDATQDAFKLFTAVQQISE